MGSLVISSVICWSTNTLPRTCSIWPSQVGISLRIPAGSRDRSGGKQDGAKDVKVTVSYSPLREALGHRWTSTPRRQTKSLNPAAVFTILGKYTELSCLVAKADI